MQGFDENGNGWILEVFDIDGNLKTRTVTYKKVYNDGTEEEIRGGVDEAIRLEFRTMTAALEEAAKIIDDGDRVALLRYRSTSGAVRVLEYHELMVIHEFYSHYYYQEAQA